WNELRSLSSWHRGMSYARLQDLGGLHWPCPDEDHPGSPFLHDRLWKDPIEGRSAPFSAVEHDPPVDTLTEEYPIRLTTGRRLDSFNTGVQTGGYASPLRRGESLDLDPEDGRRLGVADGERGAVDLEPGPPASGWEGAEVRGATEGHAGRSGRAARDRRHLLLPVLQSVQSRVGWISPGALNYICQRLTVPPAEAFGVASF